MLFISLMKIEWYEYVYHVSMLASIIYNKQTIRVPTDTFLVLINYLWIYTTPSPSGFPVMMTADACGANDDLRATYIGISGGGPVSRVSCYRLLTFDPPGVIMQIN